MNVSEVITGYLSAAGIDCVYGYPGDPNIELLEALRAGGIEFVLARREGTAALMAQAYGMVTGRPGVCMSTLGPGASNLVNGVANAYLDRTPMLAISGQIDAVREPLFTHQVIDHNRIFSPVSKWTASVLLGNVGGIMRRALALGRQHKPALRLVMRVMIDEGELDERRRRDSLLPFLAIGEALLTEVSGLQRLTDGEEG